MTVSLFTLYELRMLHILSMTICYVEPKKSSWYTIIDLQANTTVQFSREIHHALRRCVQGLELRSEAFKLRFSVASSSRLCLCKVQLRVWIVMVLGATTHNIGIYKTALESDFQWNSYWTAHSTPVRG